MFCSNCGKELKADSNFCCNCGKKVNSNTKHLVCQKCGGTMDFYDKQNVLFCAYCGSKEIIIESDYIKSEYIKNQRIENIEHDRNQSKIELEKQKWDYKLKKEKIRNKYDLIVGFSGFALLFLVFIIAITLSEIL